MLILSLWFKEFAIYLIRVYQKTISFDHGLLRFFYPNGYCRFQPTCSEYAATAINRYGLIRGGLKAVYRVIRCHPFSKGGWDPA